MKKVLIDGSKYNSIKEIHKIIGKEFDWPYYGNNLDALWDVLTTEERPFEIKWINVEESKKKLGHECISMLNLLHKVEERDKQHFPETKRFILIVG